MGVLGSQVVHAPNASAARAALSVIVVNWNSAHLLADCLASVNREAAFFGSNRWEIVVLDNASFDGSESVAGRYPNATFVQLEHNLGFARANNIGAGCSTGSRLLFLNPDTEMVAGSLSQLLICADLVVRAGAIGCCLLNSDRTFQESCVQVIPSILNQAVDFNRIHQRRFARTLSSAKMLGESVTVARTAAVSGACMLLSREAFDAVGGFSDAYFMYGEDIDLCYRLRRAGYHNRAVTSAFVVHHGGGSTRARAVVSRDRIRFQSVMMRHSMWLFMRKNGGHAASLMYRAVMLVAAVGHLGIVVFSRSQPWTKRRHTLLWRFCETRWKWWYILQWSVGSQRAWVRNGGRS